MTPAPDASEKRIRRQVIARPQAFYVIAPPGFERVCADELAGPGFPEDGGVVSEKGGVSFTGRVHDGYFANLHLRTANRILMRVESVRAENFRRLAKKVKDIAWELYLDPGTPIRIAVTTRHSRLFHTDAVSECIREGIESRFLDRSAGPAGVPPGSVEPQRIFVRGLDDTFTLSLDSSGELLYKRGIKTHGGKAPIRESLASAILFMAGYRPGDLLLDPMCGTGTFSLEAAMISNHIPAGWFRDFAFMRWPCFRQPRWEYIRKQSEERIVIRKAPVISASDQDQQACRQLEQIVGAAGLLSTVSVGNRDFFDMTPPALHDGCGKKLGGLVVINPPYGRRMSFGKQGDSFFAEIGAKLAADFRSWRVALLVPDRQWARQLPFPVHFHPVFHGGLTLALFLGRVP